MSHFTLKHLTVVGPGVPKASIEFASKLTAIVGASDTGKSYVMELIDFALGAKSLRQIPEANGYTQLLLGLTTTETEITLVRALNGGRIFVYEREIRDLTTSNPDRVLLARSSRKNPENISDFFLEELGISGAVVRKNRFNQTQRLSLRNLVHLCLVDETRMQSPLSPVESGNPTTRTAERSAFKLMLEGEDDSDIAAGEDPEQFRRVNRGRIETLETAISNLRSRAGDLRNRDQLAARSADLREQLESIDMAYAQAHAARDAIAVEFGELRRENSQRLDRLDEVSALVSRFSLLDQQYGSDIERLLAVKEAGTLLGYFDTGPCVFCGAEPEHQAKLHADFEAESLAVAADAEVEKIEALRVDLASTLEDLHQERHVLLERVQTSTARIDVLHAELASIDQRLDPVRVEMDGLLDELSTLERERSWLDQLDELEQQLAGLNQQQPDQPGPEAQGASPDSLRTFSAVLRNLLTEWNFPDAATAEFLSADPPDLYVDDRPRSARGKGVRSVLHGAFSIGLAEYCLEHSLPHVGFTVLDTPILTFRDADTEVMDEESISPLVAEAFYGYLQQSTTAQVIVLENRQPQGSLAPDCAEVYFTGQPGLGRAGFYPT